MRQHKGKLRIIVMITMLWNVQLTYARLSYVETSRMIYDKAFIPDTSLALCMTRKVF